MDESNSRQGEHVSAWSEEDFIAAYRFAAEAHVGQNYPGTEISYLMHLSFVTMEIQSALRFESGLDERLAMQCAILHDVIEDTDRDYEQVRAAFGERVADGVRALTKNSELPKAEAMADSLERIREQPREVWLVKLADRISNLQKPPHYWSKEKIERYRDEARRIHAALGEASDSLSRRLQVKIDRYPALAGLDAT